MGVDEGGKRGPRGVKVYHVFGGVIEVERSCRLGGERCMALDAKIERKQTFLFKVSSVI